jgi:hypothetical protein
VPTPSVPLAQEAIADLGALIGYVSEELWSMKARDQAALPEQALLLKAGVDRQEQDDQ